MVVIMNKTDLVNALSEDTGLTKTDAKSFLDSFCSIVKGSLKKNDIVSLIGFGSFCVATRNARKGHNPRTGATIKIPAKKIVKFKAGKELKETIK